MKRLFTTEKSAYIQYSLFSPNNPERPVERILYFTTISDSDMIIGSVFIVSDINDSLDFIVFEVIKHTFINLSIIIILIAFFITF